MPKKKESGLQISQRRLNEVLQTLSRNYSTLDVSKCGQVLDFCLYYSIASVLSPSVAKKAMNLLVSPKSFVDWNEVRVALEADVVEVLEGKVSRSREAAKVILGTLRWLFYLFHTLDLEFLREEKWDKLWKRFCQAELEMAQVSERSVLKITPPVPAVMPALLLWLHKAPLFPLGPKEGEVLYRMGVFRPETERKEMIETIGGVLSEKQLFPLHWALVEHAKKTCTSLGTMKCKRCGVTKWCAYYQVAQGNVNLTLEEVFGVQTTKKKRGRKKSV